jgi:hypothetical protein
MIPGIVESSRWVASFSDTFNRADAANIATPNLEWTEIIGDWQVASNTAYTPTAASSYPLAALDTFKENTSIISYIGSAGAGFGVAFWVVDSNNWWAVVSDVVVSTSGGYSYSCPDGGTLDGTTCNRTCYETCYQTCYEQCCKGGTCPTNAQHPAGTWAGSCGGGGFDFGCYEPGGCSCTGALAGDVNTCSCYNDLLGPKANFYIYGQYAFGCFYNYPWLPEYEFNGQCYGEKYSGTIPEGWVKGTVTETKDCNPYACNGYSCNPYACNYAATATAITITNYTHSLKLIRKLAGTVSVVETRSFGTEPTTPTYFTSVSVSTVGNVITYSGVRGGAENAYTATAVSPIKGTKHGIIMAPTTGAQGNKIDRFDYNG